MNKIDLKKYTFMTYILVMEDRQQRKQTSQISRVLHGENGKPEQGGGQGYWVGGSHHRNDFSQEKALLRRQLSKDTKKIQFSETVINSEAPKPQGRGTFLPPERDFCFEKPLCQDFFSCK